MANANDIIQTYIGINNLLLGRQQQKLAEQNAYVNRLAVIQGLGQAMVGAGGIADLAGIAQRSGIPGLEGLDSFLANTAPGEGTIRRGFERQGADALTPDRRAQLGQEAVTQTATGKGQYQLKTEDILSNLLNPDRFSNAMRDKLGEGLITRAATGQDVGAFALSSALSDLGKSDPAALKAGNRVNLGLDLSANDKLQGEIAAAGNRLGWARMTNDSALTEGSWAHEFNMQMGVAQIRANADQNINATSELQNLSSIMRNLETNKSTMSKEEIGIHLNILQTGFSRLRQDGYSMPDISKLTVDDVLGSGGGMIGLGRSWWESAKRALNR